jgi:anti-anti-sigma factor
MTTLERIDRGDVVVLKFKGSLTTEGVAEVEGAFQELTHRPAARVVVDLTGVEMVTTPAISMFIAAANYAKEHGGQIVFTESPPPVRDVLNRLRLHQVLRTCTGLDNAIREVAPGPRKGA